MTGWKKSRAISVTTAMSLCLAFGSGTIASAEQQDVTVVADALPEDVLTEEISYADLDLVSAAGVKQLNGRVKGAVRRVCSPMDQNYKVREYRACKSVVMDGARPQIDRAILRAQQLASTGTSAIAPVAIVVAVPLR